ncbi:MAG TPA: adenylyl-sulfate kinase [Candidatus Nanoarchaeia archaeon]|nr:adenylyl-sulfate kinase [Candidatus Nanoarchaeia archaeon]
MKKTKESRTIWFIGLHCSGKTTIANRLASILRQKKNSVVVLDGDEVRKTISSDLGYSLKDRNAHMKRIADLCHIITENGVLCIACVASPTHESRDYAKKILRKITTVYVRCPIDVCEQRDVKGHYKKARKNEEGFENFLGVTLKFEEPENPDVVLDTDKHSIDECATKLVDYLHKKGIMIN